jgi:hypothetical protein
MTGAKQKIAVVITFKKTKKKHPIVPRLGTSGAMPLLCAFTITFLFRAALPVICIKNTQDSWQK